MGRRVGWQRIRDAIALLYSSLASPLTSRVVSAEGMNRGETMQAAVAATAFQQVSVNIHIASKLNQHNNLCRRRPYPGYRLNHFAENYRVARGTRRLLETQKAVQVLGQLS